MEIRVRFSVSAHSGGKVCGQGLTPDNKTQQAPALTTTCLSGVMDNMPVFETVDEGSSPSGGTRDEFGERLVTQA